MRFRNVLLFVLIAGFAFSAPAESLVNKSFLGGVAIKGYDTVAYFEQSKPVEGSDDFEVEWNDATWQFSSAKHRDLFKSDPEKYAPQFGGYCAWAVSQGYTANIDPEAWKIVDDKLYLNYSKKIQAKWQANLEENIRKGHANWPGVVE